MNDDKMKLVILVRATGYETSFEAVANDPSNRGLCDDALLVLQGYNQTAEAMEIEPGEEFEIEQDQEGLIEEFVADFCSKSNLIGDYRIGDALDAGTYFYEGRRIEKRS